MEQLREFVPWVYFIASVTFIYGLKGLSGPTTAQMGNRVAAAGMLAAVIATFLEQQVASAWILVVPAIAIGTVLGFLAVVLGTINVVGGFVVTDRMLQMFKARPRPAKPAEKK